MAKSKRGQEEESISGFFRTVFKTRKDLLTAPGANATLKEIWNDAHPDQQFDNRIMSNLEARLALSPLAGAAFFALAAVLYIALSHAGRRILGPKPALDYEDPAEPTVRTLGLRTR